ncbi:MAG TPA: hypothetical protein VLA61_09200 [Ideonella sp.]|uniref:hypothetical protein n=1 Tax=Ideonella sp. TaxID=1929293 RepID=UPI002BDB5CB7|nr:hypothetical protein [Ideonella sp.]HSI48432.1 hypothetical protein [Ideonella sp.]
MSTVQIFINLFAYFCFNLGALVVWPSRRNVVAWLGLPFFVVAYLIPLFVVDYTEVASLQTIAELTMMNGIGAIAMLAGLVLGGRMKIPSLRRFRPRLGKLGGSSQSASPQARTFGVLIAGCVLMSLCFVWMGVVPILAPDPFLAKFFRGQYKEKYDQVAVFYRLSQTLMATALPLAMAFFADRREVKLLIFVLWSIGLFAAGLNRGTVVASIVLLGAIWASRRSLRMTVFLALSTVLYCLGSSIYVVLGIVVPDDFDLWAEIARGAPDIKDHLSFLGAFDPDSQLTYGLSFIGGLVPGNFRYNPSVYTLAIVNGTFDVSEIASGGFRLPPSMSGYMAFSWVGVAVVSWLTGVLTGCFTAYLRRLPRENFAQQVAGLIWFQTVAGFWIGFYALSYQGLIALVLFAYLVPRVEGLTTSEPSRRHSWLNSRLRRPRAVQRIDVPTLG